MNRFYRAALIAALFFAGGCVTSKLYESRDYTETLDAVMLSADQQWMVVLTPKHHYVFPLPAVLRETFSAGFRTKVSASFDQFSVSSAQRVSGHYRLQISDANAAEREAALAAGYRADDQTLVFDGQITGTRYAANVVRADESLRQQALNRDYRIKVSESLGPHVVALRTLVTPLAVMADGMLVIFSVPLVLVIGTDIAINGAEGLHSR